MTGFRDSDATKVLWFSFFPRQSISFLSVTGQFTYPLLGNITLQASRSLTQQCRFLFQLGRPWRTILILAWLGQRLAVHPSTLTMLGRSYTWTEVSGAKDPVCPFWEKAEFRQTIYLFTFMSTYDHYLVTWNLVCNMQAGLLDFSTSSPALISGIFLSWCFSAWYRS